MDVVDIKCWISAHLWIISRLEKYHTQNYQIKNAHVHFHRHVMNADVISYFYFAKLPIGRPGDRSTGHMLSWLRDIAWIVITDVIVMQIKLEFALCPLWFFTMDITYYILESPFFIRIERHYIFSRVIIIVLSLMSIIPTE